MTVLGDGRNYGLSFLGCGTYSQQEDKTDDHDCCSFNRLFVVVHIFLFGPSASRFQRRVRPAPFDLNRFLPKQRQSGYNNQKWDVVPNLLKAKAMEDRCSGSGVESRNCQCLSTC